MLRASPSVSMTYPSTPAVEFPETAETVQRLRREPEPERVYFDDEESWVNSAALTGEERSKLEALAPQLLIPLSVKEKLLGIISLGEKRSEEPYSGSDVRLLNPSPRKPDSPSPTPNSPPPSPRRLRAAKN